MARDWGYRCTSSGSCTCRPRTRPACGNISLTSMPLWPYFLNLNGDRIRLPVLRSCSRNLAGQRLAVVLLQHRLGVEGVHLRRAAVHEQENDVLGLGLEIGNAGAWDALDAGVASALASDSSHHAGKTEHAEAAPILHSASRRVSGCRAGKCKHLFPSLLVSSQTQIRWSSTARGRILSRPWVADPASVLRWLPDAPRRTPGPP